MNDFNYLTRRQLIKRITATAMLSLAASRGAAAVADAEKQSLGHKRDTDEPSMTVSLAGTWRFLLSGPDPSNSGGGMPMLSFTDTIDLPGTVETNRKGIASEERDTDSLTFPHSVQAPCWYETDFQVPTAWSGKRIQLLLERTKYSRIWLDGKYIGDNVIWCTPQQYDLGTALEPGKHKLTICIDNRRLPVQGAADSHMWSGNTQGNWNGIIGRIELTATDDVWLDDVQIYTDPLHRSITTKVTIGNLNRRMAAGTLRFTPLGAGIVQNSVKSQMVSLSGDKTEIETTLDLGPDAALWDEFHPHLHTLHVQLTGDGFHDEKTVRFGIRSFATYEKQFSINGRTTFLRGKHDACVFPLTGHPPMDVDGWLSYFAILHSYGLNHVRFHTWTPSDAAFEAADICGFYLQPELPFWGDFEQSVRAELEPEAKLILSRLGNHPSFVMFSMGNEPWGGRDVLAGLLADLHALDTRRLFVHGSGDGIPVTGDDYTIGGAVRLDYNHPEGTVRGANGGNPTFESHVQYGPPNTMVDYANSIATMPHPVITHEMGQYTIYPDFGQITKYTGVCQPYNLERFRKTLHEAGMDSMAETFTRVTGALAVACYREEIEACLRTPKHAGFELLDLVDYPGQGTALVGILDAFMDSKGILPADDWRRFCAPSVLLGRFERYVWTSGETFKARIEISNYGEREIRSAVLHASLTDMAGQKLASTTLPQTDCAQGELTKVGEISLPLSNVRKATKLLLTLTLPSANLSAIYPLWVYPESVVVPESDDVLVTQVFNSAAQDQLNAGKTVVLICDGSKPLARTVGGAFAPDFWNFRFFHNKPGTMGLVNQEQSAAFSQFPTDERSDWQWFTIAKNAQPIVLTGVVPGDVPLISEVVDNYDRADKIGMIFEARINSGKILVVTSDLLALESKHVEARHLLSSLMSYASSEKFMPAIAIPMDTMRTLLRTTLVLTGCKATASSTNTGWQGYGPQQIIDGNEGRGWRAGDSTVSPWWCQIEFPDPTDIVGVEVLWDIDLPGYKYTLETSTDGVTFQPISDQMSNVFQKARQDIVCAATAMKFFRIDIAAVPYDDHPPSLMELKFFAQETA